MASLSTEKESKLRTKMRMYERAFLDNSKASFEAARNGDRDLQIRYLETALANSARYKKSEKKLAELKEGKGPLTSTRPGSGPGSGKLYRLAYKRLS